MSGVSALRRLASSSLSRCGRGGQNNNTFSAAQRHQHHQQKRAYASDPNAPPKVAYPWKDPMNPGNWKEEHLVFVILGGWGAVIAGGKAALS